MELQDSPFYPFFNTNRATSRTETEQIYELLRLPEQELRNTDEEISRLHDLLNELEHRREKALTYIHKHRQLLSPIRRLPPEILAETFVRCLPSNHLPTRNLAEAPLLLTLVCKQWREIALSTPRMWCALHIYVPYSRFNDVQFIEKRKAGIQQWLERSGSLPISLSVTHKHPTWTPVHDPDNPEAPLDPYSEESPLSSLMKCLVSFSPRWGELTLNVPIAALRPIASIPPERLLVLHRISVSVPFSYTDSHNLGASFTAFLDCLPQLNALYLREHSMPEIQSGFRWSRLTELSLLPHNNADTILRYSDAIRLLLQTDNLRVCKLMVRLSSTSEQLQVTLPSLYDLTLIFSAHEEPSTHLAHSLTAPSLINLAITSSWGYENMHSAHSFYNEILTKLLGESTGIQNLHVAVAMPIGSLVQCLQSSPQIKSLTIGSARPSRFQNRRAITFPGEDVDLVNSLSPTLDSEPPLCPQLRTLKFLSMRPIPAPTAFLNLIKARKAYAAVHPDARVLRTLEVLSPSSLQPSDRSIAITDEFTQLRNDGMSIYIAYRGWHKGRENHDDLPWEGLFDDETFNSESWKTGASSSPANARLVYI